MAEQVRVENSYLKHKARPYVSNLFFKKSSTNIMLMFGGFYLFYVCCV